MNARPRDPPRGQITLRSRSNNVMFSVAGLIDGQTSYRFRTARKTYRIGVSQLMRAARGAPFTMTVSVR